MPGSAPGRWRKPYTLDWGLRLTNLRYDALLPPRLTPPQIPTPTSPLVPPRHTTADASYVRGSVSVGGWEGERVGWRERGWKRERKSDSGQVGRREGNMREPEEFTI